MIVLENIFKSYSGKNGTAEALKGVSLHVGKGDFISVSGSSGSGKTTLMNIIGCLDRPTKGRYLLEGEDIGAAAENRRGRVRNGKIGFVFQSFNLISNMTALENVALPLAIRGWDEKAASGRQRKLWPRSGFLTGFIINRPSFQVVSARGWPWPG